MSDQDRISPHDINTISSILVMRIKKNIDEGIQYQILQTDIIKTVWQTVGRVSKEILGVKGLKPIQFLNLQKVHVTFSLRWL